MKRPVIFFICMMFAVILSAQTKQQITQQATTQLNTMTPEQIDAKIKEYGMTRAEAEAKAKEYGIDLQTFLRGKTGSAPSSNVTPSTGSQLIQSGPMAGPTVEAAKGQNVEKRELPISKGLSYFGYDVFSTTPSAFEPSAVGPIDPEYIIGPEDVLRVSIWGQVEQQSELIVDKEGRILIPTTGPIVVSGLTIDEVNKTLTKQLSRSIQGLTANPKTVWLDVSLSKIRPKRVYIMGEVNNPGGYTVSSYANIFNSLFAVGGPTVNGSLREVRLIRGNKIVAKIDLYLYLVGAEKNNDVRVQNNDIIYVPVRKNTIYMKGEVRRPGIYELLPVENLKKLIEYAGGTLPTTYLERIQIERIVPLKDRTKNEFERQYKDVDFRDLNSKNSDAVVADGDVITAFPILKDIKNYVTISGAVYKPGTYQLTPNMRIRDLIELADSLKPETYFVRGELTRFEKDDRKKFSTPFDLRSIMQKDAAENVELQSKDEIVIHDIGITREVDEFVDIYGSVKKPGRYTLTRNMTLTDVLMLAEGFSEDAWTLQAEIARLEKKKQTDTLVYIYFSGLPDLRDTTSVTDFNFFTSARNKDLKMQHRDKIFIRPDPNFRIQQMVTINGEINYSGLYALVTHNEYLTELIKRAGGTTKAAYLRGGALYRTGERVNVDFQEAVNSPKSGEDIILHEGDSLYVPKKPNSIKVGGEVNNPSIIAFNEGRDLKDYIKFSGGLRDSADYIVLYHPNGTAERFGTGWFGGNSKVYDGSSIFVTKVPTPPIDKKELDIGNLIRDIFAISASALTILVLAKTL